MSQMTSLVKAATAAAKGRVRVARRAARQRRDQGAGGRGERTRPRMAERKMERRDQDFGGRDVGRGTAKRKRRPREMVRRRGMGLAPAHRGGGGWGAGLRVGLGGERADMVTVVEEGEGEGEDGRGFKFGGAKFGECSSEHTTFPGEPLDSVFLVRTLSRTVLKWAPVKDRVLR